MKRDKVKYLVSVRGRQLLAVSHNRMFILTLWKNIWPHK